MQSPFMSRILPQVESSRQVQKNQKYEVKEVLTQCGYQVQQHYTPQEVAKMLQAVEQMSAKPLRGFINNQLQHECDIHQDELDKMREQHVDIFKNQNETKNYLKNFKVAQYNKSQQFITGQTTFLYQLLQKQLHYVSELFNHMAELQQNLEQIQDFKKDDIFPVLEKSISNALKTRTPVERLVTMSRDDLVIKKYQKIFEQQYNSLKNSEQIGYNLQKPKSAQQDYVYQNITIPQPTFYATAGTMRKQLDIYQQQLDQNMNILQQQQSLVNETYQTNNKNVSGDFYQLLSEHLVDNYNFLRVYDRMQNEVRQKVDLGKYSNAPAPSPRATAMGSPNSYYQRIQERQGRPVMQQSSPQASGSDVDQMGLFLNDP